MPLHRHPIVCFMFVVLSLSSVLSACDQSISVKKSGDPVQAWIQQNAIALKTVEPGISDTDLQFLEQSVGSASIVGLGEATHGTHEVFLAKARIAEYLVSHMNFHTFAMENDWGASQLVDAYINAGSGTTSQVVQQGIGAAWQTQEMVDLLQWMRAYNANVNNSAKIHFLGMDCGSSAQGDTKMVDEIEQYFKKVDATQTVHVQELYQSLQQSASTQAQQVYDLLQSHQQVYVQRSSTQEFALTLQNARVLVQETTCTFAPVDHTAYVQRDAFMAENAIWIHDHTGESQPKMIIWAHNGHIANNPAAYTSTDLKDVKNLGGFLRAKYGQNYLSVGTALYQGSYNTYTFTPTSVTGKAEKLPVPDKDTYNYTLGSIGSKLYALDVRKTPAGPVRDWFNGKHVLLNQGVGGEDLSLNGSLKQWFDILVFIRNTSPSYSFLAK